ncbi:hypothetical protein [Euzebya tangerina]|uniref:hypothetical protein n=1 Tax=Euzebya tangerina TaxID=591198 RepID=UPI000E322D32|nr:hypothetical protein [Euzebya tangerina]
MTTRNVLPLVALIVALLATGCATRATAVGRGGLAPPAAAEPAAERPALIAETEVLPEPQGVFGAAPGNRMVLQTAEGTWALADTSVSAAGTTDLQLRTAEAEPAARWTCGSGTDQATQLDGTSILAIATPEGRCEVIDPAGAQLTIGGATGPTVLLIDIAQPLEPRLVGAVRTASDGVTLAADAAASVLYLADRMPDSHQGVLRMIDVTDPSSPTQIGRIPLAHGAELKGLEIDQADQRLYVAATTYVHVFDISQPAAPALLGRLYDSMVRNYDRISVNRISDPQFGYRTFLTVRARLGGGQSCETGFAYVYDITGDLVERPLMIADSEVPRLAEHGRPDPADPVIGECPELQVRLNGTTFRMELSWVVEHHDEWTPLRRDHFPYNITSVFQEQADYCILVPA